MVKQAKTQKKPDTQKSAVEQYFMEHGMEYDPGLVNPPDVEKFAYDHESPQDFVGPGHRPDLFAYRFTLSENRVAQLRPRGWVVVPKGQVWVRGCRHENEIILCRPLELDRESRRLRSAEHRARHMGRRNETQRIAGRNVNTSTNDHRN